MTVVCSRRQVSAKGKKRCQMGVSVQPSVTYWEDNGKRQNECRGNEKGRWNKWDKTAQEGLKKKGKKTDGASGILVGGEGRGYYTLRKETRRLKEGRRKTGRPNLWTVSDRDTKRKDTVGWWYPPLHTDCLRLSQFLFPSFIELSDDFFRLLK